MVFINESKLGLGGNLMSENKREILKKARSSRKDEREVLMDLKATKIAWIFILISVLVIALFRVQNFEPVNDLLLIGAVGALAYRVYQTIQSKSWADVIASIILGLIFVYFFSQFLIQYGVL